MSLSTSNQKKLNDCGCCEGNTALTPKQIYNRPGLPQIDYRTGTQSLFKQTMLARLSAYDYPILHKLKARNDEDFTIALLDAWACVCDNISFNSERIVNESYRLTADERLSLIELSRLIGYQFNPGVAASTHLAFTMDEALGAPEKQIKSTLIDIGSKVQSTPGPGEQAQTFETVEPLTAHVAWNAIKPRIYHPHPDPANKKKVVLQGNNLNLKKGDLIAYVYFREPQKSFDIHKIQEIDIDHNASITTITFEKGTELKPEYIHSSIPLGQISKFQSNSSLDKTTVNNIIGHSWSSENLIMLAEAQGWDIDEIESTINRQISNREQTSNTGVFVFRQTASLFGHNAPKQFSTAEQQWNEWRVSADENSKQLFLDAVYKEIIVGGYVYLITFSITKDKGVISVEDIPQLLKITSVDSVQRNAYNLSGKTTRIKLNNSWWEGYSPNKAGIVEEISTIRDTVVHLQSEQLSLADIPELTQIKRDKVILEGAFLKLKPGQIVSISGERSDLPGTQSSEVRELKEVWLNGGFTEIVFTESLDYKYIRESVTINANIAAATHGESVQEILGSGNASKTYQRFVLTQQPLTQIQADTPGGVKSTLQIRVNKVLWHEVDSLFWQGPDDHVYVTRDNNQGKTLVQFGDGINGARLPTGEDNVRAVYRKGIGLGGILKAGQLDILMSRPLGVKEAVNPLPPTGADDPETRDQLRENAPLTVLTLDRAVSLQDYEDFSRGFAGISKAKAIWILDGTQNQVFITLAGPDGASIDNSGKTHKNLLKALRKSGDPYVRIKMASYKPAFFKLDAGIIVHPDYQPETVLEIIQNRLREEFSFLRRNFVQPVARSEVIETMQNVSGVVAVDVNAFYRSESQATDSLQTRLLAKPALHLGNSQMTAAELLTLDPAPLDVRILS